MREYPNSALVIYFDQMQKENNEKQDPKLTRILQKFEKIERLITDYDLDPYEIETEDYKNDDSISDEVRDKLSNTLEDIYEHLHDLFPEAEGIFFTSVHSEAEGISSDAMERGYFFSITFPERRFITEENWTIYC